MNALLWELEARQNGRWRVIVSICKRKGWRGGKELLHGSSNMVAVLASAGEGWDEGLRKGSIADLGSSERFQMLSHGSD